MGVNFTHTHTHRLAERRHDLSEEKINPLVRWKAPFSS